MAETLKQLRATNSALRRELAILQSKLDDERSWRRQAERDASCLAMRNGDLRQTLDGALEVGDRIRGLRAQARRATMR